MVDAKIRSALEQVRKILDNTKTVVLAQPSVNHQYEDKYKLAEFVVNIGLASAFNDLEFLGV